MMNNQVVEVADDGGRIFANHHQHQSMLSTANNKSAIRTSSSSNEELRASSARPENAAFSGGQSPITSLRNWCSENSDTIDDQKSQQQCQQHQELQLIQLPSHSELRQQLVLHRPDFIHNNNHDGGTIVRHQLTSSEHPEHQQLQNHHHHHDVQLQHGCLTNRSISSSSSGPYHHLQYVGSSNPVLGSVLGADLSSIKSPISSGADGTFLPSISYYNQGQLDKTTLDNASQLFYNQQLMNTGVRQHLIENCQFLNVNNNNQTNSMMISNNNNNNIDNNSGSLSSMGSLNCDDESPAKFLADNMLPLSENELEQISVRELNKLLQGQERSLISKVKAKRRTLKNRGYALKCRSRRVEIQHKLTGENKQLREQLAATKHQLAILQAQLQAVLHDKSMAINSSANDATINLHMNLQQQQQQQAHGYYHRQAVCDPNGLVPLNMAPIFSNAVNRCVFPVPALCLAPSNENQTSSNNNNNALLKPEATIAAENRGKSISIDQQSPATKITHWSSTNNEANNPACFDQYSSPNKINNVESSST